MKKHVVIIGGGASGLMAAISAARMDARVTILEHMDRVGKKILSTGNGKCNITNLYQDSDCYRGQYPDFATKVLKQFNEKDTMDFFAGLGLAYKNRNGYIYPNSEQASSVLDVLRLELDSLQVKTECGIQVNAIQPVKDHYTIVTDRGTFHSDTLILSTGSKAAPKTGSDGSGYHLACKLGHTIIDPVPALVQLRSDDKAFKQLAGIRTEAQISLYIDNHFVRNEIGELQLTEYGISGIPVFQLSRFAARALLENRKVAVQIDFYPSMDEEMLYEMFHKKTQRQPYKTIEEHFIGVLNKKLAAVLIRKTGIEPDNKTFNHAQLKVLLQTIKHYPVNVQSTNSFDQAQVCAGGVSTNEIAPENLESKIRKNLYITGELLDIDGACGGYNLQWAWSTGFLAGKSAGMRE